MLNLTINLQMIHKLAGALLTALLLAALPFFQEARASELGGDDKTTGIVQVMPASGLVGDWVISGTTYRTTASSEIRTKDGPFVIGACVEVEFVTNGTPIVVEKLSTEDPDKCGNDANETPDSTEMPHATTTPDATSTPGLKREIRGIVNVMPGPGLLGTWIVDGVEYIANGATDLEQDEGPFVTGACVKVEFFPSTTPRVADQIRTEEQHRCLNATATPSGTPGTTATPDGTTTATPDVTGTPAGEIELFGRVDTFPSGLVGDWVVNGVTYRATSGTEFKQEHGPFAVSACVKLHVQTNSSPRTMREIETEQEFRCGVGDTATPEAELFGLLQSFPVSLIGVWNIGGMTFVADANTEFKQEHGLFAPGMTVKVHFSLQNGTNRAREIETKFANDSAGSDDDGNGTFEGSEGHAFGRIDSVPTGLKGTWEISGIEYTANDSTIFEQSDGSFAVGARVKVEYFLDANSNRVAQKIETTNDDGGAGREDRFKLFGFVNQMPPNSFLGSWVVDNIAFVTDANTQFKEEQGLLSLGSFVAVEYFINDGRNQIHEIETHVPPGAGENSAIGDIQSLGGAVTASNLSSGATWVIGGTSYVVNPATDLNEVDGALTVGATALVNSYEVPDGSEVATQIRGVTLDNKVMLPLVISKQID